MVTDAKRRANNKHDSKTYDVISLRVRKDRGGKELVQKAAELAGETTGVYIMRAVYDRMKVEGLDVPGGDDQQDETRNK